MRAPLLALAVVAFATSFTGAANAAALPPPAAGLTCGLATTSDPIGLLVNPGTQVGVEWGGPVATTTGTVGISCTIQAGGTGIHSEPDVPVPPHSATGALVAVVPPALVSYLAVTTDPVWVCTEVTLGGTTWYYDAASGRLSTDPTTARCALAISQQVPPCDSLGDTCAAVEQLCAVVVDCDLPADVRLVVPEVFETLV